MEKDRKQIEREGPGRREEDFRPKCHFCDIKDLQSKERWQNLSEKTKERDATCSRIIDTLNNEVEEIKKYQKSLVPWTALVLFVTVLIATLGTFGSIMLSGQKEIKDVVHEISTSTYSISLEQTKFNTKVETFEREIKALNDRQDVLRNAHMKIMNDKSKAVP